jgi:hypothetical protein
MTKDLGFNYDRPAKTEMKRGGRLLSYAFDALLPLVLICVAYTVSRYYFLGI